MAGLLHNYVLFSAVISWVAAQVIKAILNLIQTGEFKLERLFGSGGMPSSHSACVCALTLSIARSVGLGSIEFALSFILAVVVMYDAMGVRRSAGEHSRILNEMMRQKNKDETVASFVNKKQKELKEALGHTPLEVLSGALLGILIAMLMPVMQAA